jgi:hypothetical protein
MQALAALGIVWFFTWHLLESTIIPLELVFEHRNYLASYGIILAVTLATATAFKVIGARNAAIAISASFLVAVLAFATHTRAHTWGSWEEFHLAEYERAPNSVRAVENMYFYERQWGNHARASYYLARLQDLASGQAWPVVLEIIALCPAGPVSDDLMNLALGNARTGLVRPSDIVALRRLTEQVESGECSSEMAPFSQELASSLAASNRIHTKVTRIRLLKELGTSAAVNGDLDIASFALRTAMSLASDHSYGLLAEVAKHAADVAKRVQDPTIADRFFRTVVGPHLERLEADGFALAETQ